MDFDTPNARNASGRGGRTAALKFYEIPDNLGTGPVGNPFALHAGEPGNVEFLQHIHVLTLTGLRAIYAAYGFRVERVFAAGYYPATGRLAAALARRDPRHAHFIGLVVSIGH